MPARREGSAVRRVLGRRRRAGWLGAGVAPRSPRRPTRRRGRCPCSSMPCWATPPPPAHRVAGVCRAPRGRRRHLDAFSMSVSRWPTLPPRPRALPAAPCARTPPPWRGARVPPQLRRVSPRAYGVPHVRGRTLHQAKARRRELFRFPGAHAARRDRVEPSRAAGRWESRSIGWRARGRRIRAERKRGVGDALAIKCPLHGQPQSLSSLSPVKALGLERLSSSTMLAVPVRTKFSGGGGNARFDYGVSSMQGYRENMEDAHVTLEDLDAASATSFFAVYDGHGGPAVARYCANHLHTELRANEEFHSNLGTAVQTTFLRMDEMLRNREAGRELSQYGGADGQWERYRWKSCFKHIIPCVKPVYEGPQDDGCTACVALIRGNNIVVGNAGDSRCIISRNGQAMDLSTDHKPHLPAETQRIENAGHEVTMFPERGGIPRVDNGIAISRSIGDLRYKDNANLPPQQQALTAFPDVRTEVITDDTEFLFMACDGIWDCMSSQDVVEFVGLHPSEVYQPVAICEALLDHCLKLPRGKDNMTALLVRFKRPVQAGSSQQPIQASAAKSGTGTSQSSSGKGGSGSDRLSKSSEL